MSEKLLNIKEVCQYLNISQEDLRTLVDRGEIPAYRLGGTILRFRRDQIDILKNKGVPKVAKSDDLAQAYVAESRLDSFKDFLYFNDFYIISAIVILILLFVSFAY